MFLRAHRHEHPPGKKNSEPAKKTVILVNISAIQSNCNAHLGIYFIHSPRTATCCQHYIN